MPEQHYNQEDIDKAEVGRKIHVLGTPNLYFIKNAKGVARYFYRYPRPGPTEINPKTGRPKSPTTEIHVGKPGITLDKARIIADKYAEWLRDGIDPQEAMQWKSREEKTLGQLGDQFIEESQLSGKRLREANLYLHAYGKKLTNLRMVQIRSEVVRDALKPFLKTAPHQFHRALGFLKKIIDYATVLKAFAGPNPADWKTLKLLFPAYSPTQRGHFKAMPCEQVPEFYRALDQRRGEGALALKLLLLTLLRTGEVLGAQWSEFDWDNRIWTVPAERMKNKEVFQVPLSDPAFEFLRHLEDRAISRHVFTGYKYDQRLSPNAMLTTMRRMGISKELATVHALRASYGSWVGRQGQAVDQIAAQICLSHTLKNSFIQNHLLPFNPTVLEAYRRDKLIDQRRPIIEAWAKFICKSH